MSVYFTEDHEWIKFDGDTGTVGITPYAAGQLGDVVYVELPEIGREVGKRDEAAVVESVKAASEVYAPVSGEVIEVNEKLEEAPDAEALNAMGCDFIQGFYFGRPAPLAEIAPAEVGASHAKASHPKASHPKARL